MNDALIRTLRQAWPALKSQPGFFALATGREPVLLVYKRETDADPRKALKQIQDEDPAYRSSVIAVGQAQVVDGALVLRPNAARSLGRLTTQTAAKALTEVGKALAKGAPEIAAVVRTGLYEVAPDQAPQRQNDDTALTLDAASWRAFSSKRFSRRSAELKAIDAAFDAYDPTGSDEARLDQLAALARAIQTWMEKKDGDSGRMEKVQALALQVARERERLQGALEDDRPLGGMTQPLAERLKEFAPTVLGGTGFFALAPNRGRPLLALAKTEINGAKAKAIFGDGGAEFTGGVIYAGNVEQLDGRPHFVIVPDRGSGAPNKSDLAARLARLPTDPEVKKAGVDAGSFRRVTVSIAGEPPNRPGVTVQSDPSRKARILNSRFAQVREAADELDQITDPHERAEAEDGLRSTAVAWMTKNAGRTNAGDDQKRAEMWDTIKMLGSRTTVATGPELRIACAQLKREFDAAVNLADLDARREALHVLDGELLNWLDKAEENGDRASIIELRQLRGRLQRALDALPDEEADGDVDFEEEIRDLRVYLSALGDEETKDEDRPDIAETIRQNAELLLEAAQRRGEADYARALRLILAQVERPWSFEKNLPWKPVFRVEFMGLSARGGGTLGEGQTWEQLDTDLMNRVKQALVDGQRLRLDEGRKLLDVGYPLQQLREINYAVFALIHGATPGLQGRALERKAPPNYGDYEKIESAFGNPEALAEIERRRKQVLGRARDVNRNPPYSDYDAIFNEEFVGNLRDQVNTSGSPKEAMLRVLGEMGDRGGLLLGEEHDKVDQKQLLIDNVDELIEQGVDTLYVEHFRVEDHQASVDHYLETGEIDEVLEGYLKTQAFKFDEVKHPYDLRGLLETARAKGLRVVGIDSMNAKADPGLDFSRHKLAPQQRVRRMNALSGDVIKNDGGRTGKFVALIGSKHANTHEGGVPGLSQIVGAPSIEVSGGTARLQEEDRDLRAGPMEPGERASLIRAVSKAPRALTAYHGHEMHFEVDIAVPPETTGEDYSDRREGLHTFYGVSLEWWERIERIWEFDNDGTMTDNELAQARANGRGRSLKPWGDLVHFLPSSPTYKQWNEALDAAAAGTPDRPRTTIVINDKPGVLSSKAEVHTKRVLQFRHVMKDSYGKVMEVKAIQILVVEQGVLVYSLYNDSNGNSMETIAPNRARGDFTSDQEIEPRFDLDRDLPTADGPYVRQLLDAIADGTAAPAVDPTWVAIEQWLANAPAPKPASLASCVEIVAKPPKCSCLPMPRSGESWVQGPASGGNLLVALIRGSTPIRMYRTSVNASGVAEFNLYAMSGPAQINFPTRDYVQVPLEEYME